MNELGNTPAEKGYQPADATKEQDKYMEKMRDALLSSWAGHDTELQQASKALVDAVDRYTMGKCLRSELLIKNNELKKLLK